MTSLLFCKRILASALRLDHRGHGCQIRGNVWGASLIQERDDSLCPSGGSGAGEAWLSSETLLKLELQWSGCGRERMWSRGDMEVVGLCN